MAVWKEKCSYSWATHAGEIEIILINGPMNHPDEWFVFSRQLGINKAITNLELSADIDEAKAKALDIVFEELDAIKRDLCEVCVS